MKTGNLYCGEEFFEEMVMKNVVSWTSLLAGYANNGFLEKALEVFCQMQEEEVQPNPFTYATVFGALADLGTSEKGIQVHTQVIKVGLESSTYVGNSLINMYLKFGLVGDAKIVFMNVESKDVVSWNGMIAGLVNNALDLEALKLFHEMKHAGVQPTQSIFAPVIKACTYIEELCYVEQLQCQVTKRGFETDLNIRTALMVAYSKSSRMDDAIEMFNTMKGSQNVVSWTAMMSGYLQSNRKAEAINLFLEMNRAGVIPNDFTFSMILTAHPLVSPFQVHAQLIKTNHKDSACAGTALLDAYVKTGNNQEATKVFEKVAVKDIVMWSAMLSGYAQAGNIERAVDIFSQMIKEGIKPNEFTFSGILNVCASPTASAEQGKQFHAASIKYGQSNALAVSSALVTMYAKRGNIESANDVFRRQGARDLVSWNSMISGFAQHGYGKRALEIFEEMRKKKMDMDGITFIGVITACTHAGLAEDGQMFFNLMVKDLHIKPTVEHYACMVDLYGRAGKLDKAMNLINKMPFPADATIWRTLLGACRVQKNVELGEMAAEKLMVLQPQHSAAYVLLSNIYAATGNWNERAKVRSLMDKRKVKKEAGYSWIVLKNKTHAFLAGDRSHPLSNLIYSKLQELTTRLKDMGYRPDTNFVLHDIEDELKEGMLFQHSERLAVVLGLISTPNGTPLQIEKNLRVIQIPQEGSDEKNFHEKQKIRSKRRKPFLKNITQIEWAAIEAIRRAVWLFPTSKKI
ncbi:hypothetical protein V2J09_002814 [Rumex salicifolius]